jgi:hypothetical protein
VEAEEDRFDEAVKLLLGTDAMAAVGDVDGKDIA